MQCSQCHQEVQQDWYYCPNCGKVLRESPPATTLARQMYVYAISLFLPPFGLWYVWKYMKQTNTKSRVVGLVALVLTLVSTYASYLLALRTRDAINAQLNMINSFNSL